MPIQLQAFWKPAIDSRQHGRITRPENYRGSQREILTYCSRVVRITRRELERHYGWRLKRLDFFFLNTAAVNACMFQLRRRHGVGMYIGLPFTVKSNLDRAMADQEFLPIT